jgi:hypothetical protein
MSQLSSSEVFYDIDRETYAKGEKIFGNTWMECTN